MMICFQDINWTTFGITVGIMIGIAVLLGVLIMVISRFFHVEKDARIDEIVNNLPKANCGACGYPGCEGFAKALIDGKANVDDCKVSKKENKTEIANILGQSFVAVVDPDLCISCGICINTCPKKIIKRIPKSAKIYVACSTECKGKDVISVCKNGCISCGICERTCQHDAIHLVNNVPVVDYSKCTGCKECLVKCPKKVIKER